MTELRPSDTDEPNETAHLLKMLRKRVRYLTQEIRRLREENASLGERLEELEALVDHEGTLVTLDEEPEVLRERIEQYIQAIDRQLGQR